MKRLVAHILIIVAGFAVSGAASAEIVARVSTAQQSMQVYVDGELHAVWPVSTARRGYRTPSGSFRPQSFARYHRSSRYHGSPMPYSVFFHGNYAIHGSYARRSLGRRASHGCIRLDPDNAREFYHLVRGHGAGQTRIVVGH
jgi:lipoprotein-anchoring transpeptidase ErfK/SrfK